MINIKYKTKAFVNDVISFLERLIQYDTRTNENSPGKDVKPLLESELESKFRENGFDVEYFESNGHHSLLATRIGVEPSILYSGHVDVVPWDDRWDTDPTTMVTAIEAGEEVVKGRGVSDMKSGIAALMLVLPEISKSNLTVYFAITGDEEISGEDGTKVIVDHLVREGQLPRYVITADAAGMEIITRRRNVFDAFVSSQKDLRTVVGTIEKKTFTTEIISSPTSHAAYFRKEHDKHALKLAIDYINENGYLPITVKGNFVKVNVIPNDVEIEYVVPNDEGDEILYDFGLHALLNFASNVMNISFETQAASDYDINSTSNVIHDSENKWELEVDIRAMLDHEAEELEGQILLLQDNINWMLNVELKKSIGFIATSDDSPLVKSTTKILQDIGYSGKSAERGGATDGRFFAQHGIETIDIGAIGWNVHGPNETATTKSIRDLVTFFERSALELEKLHKK
jgi:succinyl-diaminopimelate desuccinylase